MRINFLKNDTLMHVAGDRLSLESWAHAKHHARLSRYIVDSVSSVGNVLDWDAGQTQKGVTGKLKH